MSSTKFPSFVALRYSMPYFNRGITGLLSFVSLLGLMLAVSTLVIVISVMNGFERELQNRMLALLPHAKLHWDVNQPDWPELRHELARQPGIDGVAPYIEGSSLLSASGQMANVTLVAIDPNLENQVSSLSSSLVAGDMQRLSEQPFGVVIGSYLGRQLGVTLGDKISITTPRIYITPFGPLNQKTPLEVVGVFEVGAELDQNLAITDLRSGRLLFGRSHAVDGLRIAVEDQYQSQIVLKQSVAALQRKGILTENVSWTDWRDEHRSLYRAVIMEKTMIFVLLLAVVAVASFNVISIILMTVTDKRGDIAVLKTMGASTAQIRNLFILQGSMIGAFGTLSGALLGALIANDAGNILRAIESATGWRLFDPEVYYIPYLPSVLRFSDVMVVVVSAISISIVVTLVPAVRASNIPPALALREAS